MFKEFLSRKGWISTLLGALLALGVIIKTLIDFYINMEFSEVKIITVSVLIALAVLLIILPSKLEFNAGKITFKVED